MTQDPPPSAAVDPAKLSLYEYVRAQNDVYASSRSLWISRFGNIYVLAGLLLSVFSFTTGILVETARHADTFAWKAAVGVPVVCFLVSIYQIVRSLCTVPNLVGSVAFQAPGVDATAITMAVGEETLDHRAMIDEFTLNYLDAIVENSRINQQADEALKRSSRSMLLGLFAGGAYVLSTLVLGLLCAWMIQSPPAEVIIKSVNGDVRLANPRELALPGGFNNGHTKGSKSGSGAGATRHKDREIHASF